MTARSCGAGQGVAEAHPQPPTATSGAYPDGPCLADPERLTPPDRRGSALSLRSAPRGRRGGGPEGERDAHPSRHLQLEVQPLSETPKVRQRVPNGLESGRRHLVELLAAATPLRRRLARTGAEVPLCLEPPQGFVDSPQGERSRGLLLELFPVRPASPATRIRSRAASAPGRYFSGIVRVTIGIRHR
jgi:hypothetical protein